MLNINVNGTQDFMGHQIPVATGAFGANEKFISDKTAAEIHGTKVPHIRELIGNNIEKFTEGVDIIDVAPERVRQDKQDDTSTIDILVKLGYAKQAISQAKHIYLLSASGYTKLVGIMNSTAAWDIHDRLAKEYFVTNMPIKVQENPITVSGTQLFMGKEIPVVLGGFGPDKKCICDKTIAEIHEQPVYEIRKSISRNIARFQENVDYINVCKGSNEITTLPTLKILEALGYSKQAITQAECIYLLSERGYYKLIKIMDTDLAWEVHDRLVDKYFTMREQLQYGVPFSELSPELQTLQSIVNVLAKTEIEQKRLTVALQSMDQKYTDMRTEMDGIRGVVSLNKENWREDSRKLISQIAQKRDNDYQAVYNECFALVDERAGASLDRRLANRRKRMADEGISKSKQDKFTRVDVIAEDKRLIEIYLAVVKDMAIHYGVA